MTLRAIFYDTETTGFDAAKDRIIEIAAYDATTQASFVSLVNPGCPIPPETTAIHNITNEMVVSAPTFAEVLPEFLKFCEGDVVLIAHNNDAFDIHFLKHEFTRAQKEMPDWKFLDTLKWARKYRPDLPRHSLQFLREVYGIEANNAHRALDDVIILQKVFSLMTGDLTLEDIHTLSKQVRQLQHMPFGKHQGKPLAKVPKEYVAWLADSGAFNKSENKELKSRFLELGLLSN